MSGGPWWRVGWRNLGRNRRRTVLTASALALGYFAVVVLAGLSRGLVSEMIRNGTAIISGQLQVHASDYLPQRSVYATIGGATGIDVGDLLQAVAADPAIRAAAPRVYGGGLLSAGAATVGAVLMGIAPDREGAVSRIAAAIEAGRLPRLGQRELMIGQEVARRLGAAPGDTLVVVAPAADGSLGNDLFVVTGVFATGLTDLDGAYALLPIDMLQRLIVLPSDRIHEVAARVDDPWQAPQVAQRVADRVALRGLGVAVEPWTVFRPELADYARLSLATEWVMLAIVFAMAVFGVANTLLMATFERRREFALLLALGAAPGGIVRSVIAEALALGSLSLVAGALVTAPVLVWWHVAPLDLSRIVGGFTMAGAFIRPVFRIEYPWAMMAYSAVALLGTAVAAAVYPALRASRVSPADTLTGH